MADEIKLNPAALRPLYDLLKRLHSHPDFVVAYFRNAEIDRQATDVLRLAEGKEPLADALGRGAKR